MWEENGRRWDDYQNDSIDFVRLEELKEPGVKSITGEHAGEW